MGHTVSQMSSLWEKEHILPQFPKYIAKIQSGKTTPQNICCNYQCLRNPPGRCNKPDSCKAAQHNLLKDPKIKAFLADFQALLANNNDDNDEDQDEDQNKNEQDIYQHEDHDLHGFLFMVGPLKE
jgi:hypothetical protein